MGQKPLKLERSDAVKIKENYQKNKYDSKNNKEKVDSNLPPSVYGEICIRKRARRKRQKILVIEMLLDYAKNSTLHGLRYLSERGLTILEKIFWLLTFLASVAMCTYLIRNVYIKWKYSPVIVSFNEHIVPVDNVPFPSVTICPQSKIDTAIYNFSGEYERVRFKLKDVKNNLPTKLPLEAEMMQDISLLCKYLGKYIKGYHRNRANSTLVNNIVKVAPKFNDIFYHCEWRGNPIDCEKHFKRVLTSEGVCYNFNSLAADDIFNMENIQRDYEYIQNTSKQKSGWTLLDGYKNFDKDAYPLRGRENGANPDLEVYLIDDTASKDALCNRWARGFKIFVQNPLDLPQSTLYYYAALPKQVSSLALKFSMLTTTESLQGYDSKVRQCYFPHDRPLRYFKEYTLNNCRMECLSNYTFAECDCVAFYMPHDNSEHICSADKENCIVFAANNLSNVDIQKNTDGGCQCFPDCHNIYYDAEILKTDFDFKNFLNNLITPRKKNYVEETVQFSKIEMYFKEPHFVSIRRSELFGITDFLSNIGGLLGLFLGFSFLSLVEIFYFLSLRLFYTLKRDLQEEKNNGIKSIN